MILLQLQKKNMFFQQNSYDTKINASTLPVPHNYFSTPFPKQNKLNI